MRLISLAFAIAALAQDKPKQDPPLAADKPPSLRTLMECTPHRLKDEFDDLARINLGGSAVTSDACSFAGALKRVRTWLDTNTKPDAIATLKADPQAAKAAGLVGIAGAAAAGRRMTPAIAALMEAVALEPDNATALANLAAALSTVGLCAEAITIADAALPKTKDQIGALGIPLAAVVHNARGFALIRQGKFADAVEPLRKAVELGGPLCSDAQMNLAYALKKSGKDDEAKPFFLGACWRRPVEKPVCTGGKSRKPGDPPKSPYDKGVSTRAPAALLFDLSFGKPGKLPTFKHPDDVKQWKAFDTFFKRETKEYADYMAKFAAWVESQKNTKPGNTLSDKRALHVNAMIQHIEADPDVAPFFEAMEKGLADLNAKTKPIFEAGQKTTLEIVKAGGKDTQAKLLEHANALIGKVHGPCTEYDTLVRKYWDIARKYQSGLAANIKAPYWHDRAVWRIRGDMWTMWFGRLLSAIHMNYQLAYLTAGAPNENAGTLDVPEKAGPEDEETPN